jgi:pre-mRNA 3'-end-processing factor FIP1
MRSDITDEKKKMQDFGMMMDMGGMPQMPAMPGMPQQSGPGQMPSMPGMGDIPPEMQAMMAQMMAQGADPSQMDPAALFAAMQQAGGQAQGGIQGQGFGGGQGFGAQNQQPQQMGFGYDQNMMAGNEAGGAGAGAAGGGNRNRQGNFNNRGRGGNRRNW